MTVVSSGPLTFSKLLRTLATGSINLDSPLNRYSRDESLVLRPPLLRNTRLWILRAIAESPVAIYFDFELPPNAHMPFLIQADVQAILPPLGFDLQWRARGPASQEVWSDLAFVSFRGQCDIGLAALGRFQIGALGSVQAINGEVQPFVEIDCSRIGALLETQLPLLRAQTPERLFARAVARVVAHELYHVFVKTKIHDNSGVGKPEFTASDLLSNHFEFSKDQTRALRDKSVEAARLFYGQRR